MMIPTMLHGLVNGIMVLFHTHVDDTFSVNIYWYETKATKLKTQCFQCCELHVTVSAMMAYVADY
jgi:hypothetical protein